MNVRLLTVALLLTAAALRADDTDRITLFVRSIAPYEEARGDLLAIAPDGVHIPQLSADPDEADRQAAELRAAGVRYLFQYKDLFTRTPSGLQSIYDELWPQWVEQGIFTRPRPATPPEEWTQRGPDGAILRAYSDSRYMMCPNNPDWRIFAHEQIVALARNHGDGVMCDNPMCECYCAHCQARFDEWMRARHTDEDLRSIFGLDPAQQPLAMTLPDADADTQRVLLGACRRFWVDAMADFFRWVKAAGEEVHGAGNFLVAPNSSGQRWFYTQTAHGVELVEWGDAVSTSYVEPGQAPGVATTEYYCGLADTLYHRNLFDYLYGASRPEGAESLLLKAYTGLMANPPVASLALAEGVALGGAFIIYPTADLSPAAPNMTVQWALPMVSFIHANSDRLQAMRPAADVAVLYSPNDMMCGFPEHLDQAVATCAILQRLHVPNRLIHLSLLEESLAADPPQVLIVPNLRCLSQETVARLRALPGAGVKLLAIGEVGTHSEEGRARGRAAIGSAPAGELRVRRGVAHLNLTVTETLARPVALLYGALDELLGGPPSAVAPDEFSSLLVTASRSDDGRTRWLHLLDYAAPLGERGAAAPDPVRRNVEALMALPDGVRPNAATLIRPGDEPRPLEFEAGREGLRVTVPEMTVYALVEVTIEDGPRPARALLDRSTAAHWRERAGDAVRLVQVGPPVTLEPIAESATAPMAEAPPGLRYASPWYVRVERAGPMVVDTWAFGKDGGRPVALRLVSLDGTPVAEAVGCRGIDSRTDRVWSGPEQAVLHVPEPGVYLLLAEAGGNHYRIRPHCAQAAVECHAARPLRTADDRPLGPLYFYAPLGCEAFTLSAVAEQSGETCRIIVRDPEGREVLSEAGEMDARQDFRIEVPEGARGRAWSFTIGPGEIGVQDDVIIMLDGVPPLVAESPERLLTPVGD